MTWLGLLIVGLCLACLAIDRRWGKPGPEVEPFGAEQSFELPGSEKGERR